MSKPHANKPTPVPKTEYIGLARVSTVEQRKENASLETQDEIIRRRIADLGGTPDRIWQFAETASRAAERKVFREIIDYAKANAHRLAGLVVVSLDRGTRNLPDYMALEELEKRYKVRLVVVQQEFSDSAFGRKCRRDAANDAAYYSERLSEVVSQGQAARARRGLMLGQAAYGYRNVRAGDRRVIDVDPEKSKRIRRVYYLYAYTRLSVDDIRAKFHEEGVPFSAKSRKWPRSYLYRILRNRVYLGEVRHHDEWFPGKHPPLIDIHTWNRVQEKLRNLTRSPLATIYGHGCIRCGFCGRAVIAEQITKEKSGRVYTYYRCCQNKRTPGHPPARITEQKIDEQVIALFDRLRIADPDVREWIIGVLRTRTAENRLEAKARAAEVTRQIGNLDEMLTRLTDMRMAAEIDRDEFLTRKATMLESRDRLKAQMDIAAKTRDETNEVAIRAFELAQNLRQRWVAADFPEKRRILEILWLNCRLVGASVSYTLRKPFDMLADPDEADGSGRGGSRTLKARARPFSRRLPSPVGSPFRMARRTAPARKGSRGGFTARGRPRGWRSAGPRRTSCRPVRPLSPRSAWRTRRTGRSPRTPGCSRRRRSWPASWPRRAR